MGSLIRFGKDFGNITDFSSQTPTIITYGFSETKIVGIRLTSDVAAEFRIWFMKSNSTIANDAYNNSKVDMIIDMPAPVQGNETSPLFHSFLSTEIYIQSDMILRTGLPIIIENKTGVPANVYIELVGVI